MIYKSGKSNLYSERKLLSYYSVSLLQYLKIQYRISQFRAFGIQQKIEIINNYSLLLSQEYRK